MPLPPQRTVRMPQRLSDTQRRRFLRIGRRRVHGTTLDKDGHKEDKGYTHQHDGPPIFLHGQRKAIRHDLGSNASENRLTVIH